MSKPSILIQQYMPTKKQIEYERYNAIVDWILVYILFGYRLLAVEVEAVVVLLG